MKRWLAVLVCATLFLTSALPGLAEEIEATGAAAVVESASSVGSGEGSAERDIDLGSGAEKNDPGEDSAVTADQDHTVDAEAEASEAPEIEATNAASEDGESVPADDTAGQDDDAVDAEAEASEDPEAEATSLASEDGESVPADDTAGQDDTVDAEAEPANETDDMPEEEPTAEASEDIADAPKTSEDDTREAENASVESDEKATGEGSALSDAAEASHEVPAADAETPSKVTRIAILSDIHYVTDQLLSEAGKANVELSAKAEVRLMEEIDAIVTSALKDAASTNPDVMVVCGDLVSNGELLGARALADKLKSAKSLEGFQNTGMYVVNGNHDINNSYAADYTGDTIQNASRVQPEDFSEIFSGLGYGEDDHYAGGTHSVYVPTDDPTVITNHGGLSYATDVADGITLIVLDTAIYRTDEVGESQYNEAQKTGGYVSDDLLEWAKAQAEAAKQNGNLVLAMCHHGIVPHFDLEYQKDIPFYTNETIISNWEDVEDRLADAGVSAVLTGHFHTNDISMHVSKNNNVLYDIETAALSAYPCAWRTLDITTNGEGENKTYTFSINTSNIDGDLGVDTSAWTFTIGDEVRSFDDYYGKDLQKYAYDKTGITEGSVVPMADYLIKAYLYDIVNHKGGIAGFIGEKLGLQEGQSLGDYALSALTGQLGKLSNITKEIPLSFFGTYTLKTGEMKNIPDADVTDEELAATQPTLDLTLDSDSTHEEGQISIDLSYIRTAVNGFLDKLQKELTEGEWMKSPYASAPLLKDVSGILENGLLPALTKPIEGADPDYSTPLEMLNDAYQADADGDEGLADEETRQRWENERELLRSEALSKDIADGLTKQVASISDSKYPAIFELLKSQRLVAEGKNSVFKLDLKEGANTLNLADAMLGISRIDTLASLIAPLSTVTGMGVSLPADVVKPIQETAAILHESKTSDRNILHDTVWSFHTVRFDANGGKVRQTLASTVEGNKIVSLPEPEARSGYTFDGWFTAPRGGDPVSVEDDMSDVDTVYAHWTYVGSPEKDKDTRVVSSNDAVAEDLHVEFFGSIQNAHDTIQASEASDLEHDAFCDGIAAQLAMKAEEAPVIDMGEWLSLNAEAVKAIEAYGSDITLLFACQGVHFRCVIPAGFDFKPCSDENGSVCVLCVAEAVGYERIKNA